MTLEEHKIQTGTPIVVRTAIRGQRVDLPPHVAALVPEDVEDVTVSAVVTTAKRVSPEGKRVTCPWFAGDVSFNVSTGFWHGRPRHSLRRFERPGSVRYAIAPGGAEVASDKESGPILVDSTPDGSWLRLTLTDAGAFWRAREERQARERNEIEKLEKERWSRLSLFDRLQEAVENKLAGRDIRSGTTVRGTLREVLADDSSTEDKVTAIAEVIGELVVAISAANRASDRLRSVLESFDRDTVWTRPERKD